ncbi:low-temperature-induced 65 kDa protein [Panicum miliaceum]|uniref:Low-temperature-induced 65 kDa protein n=1 Tax=Panicum miliaceum TaxID=4540 RepID=A0A3L6TQF7_PANMI|nr:low-temperature-induced 65 kDa protein [Panicum miliaceum]
MDAPAMVTRKHVPEDVSLRNVGEDEAAAGGQGQLHREEKQHKPVLKKVKEKVKKIKNTLAGHGHGGDERGAGDAARSTSSEEGEEDAAERETALEKGGYMEDVEDKPVVAESDPEVHGAPMYESARAPAVQDLVAKYDPARKPAGQEMEGDGAPGVRLGDLGGPVVEDPAAPRSTTPAAREGEDIGTTPVVQQFETMNLSDDPAHVGVGKKDAKVEEWKDAAADKMGGTAGGASYTDKLRNAAVGTTEYGKKLASTVYEKVAGTGTDTGAGKRDDERAEAALASDACTEERRDAPAATDATNGSSGPGYTDKIKSAAAGTTEYGKQLASTVYEKVAGVGTAVAPNLRPQVGAGKPEDARSEAMPVSDTGAEAEEWKDASAPAATDATNDSASGPGYTDKIKSAAAGTTEYGKQLASTVYEKVAGVGTAVVGKVQQATPGVGAQQQDTSAAAASPGAGGQDKGVTVTGYIAEKLRPGDEDRALSEAISGAVQRRKEDVGGTVAQRVPAPGQVMTKAREAVTSLTGGNRVSETVQPSTATAKEKGNTRPVDHELTWDELCDAGEEVKEGYAAEAPVIHGEEVGGARLNTNTM